MQMLNVALGGTLDQHVPDAVGHEDHRAVPGTFSDHEVRLEPGSLAARAVGSESSAVKSHHHQGIDELGEGLRVTGRAADDELPEAIELAGDRFALGVLWHPEEDERSRVISALRGARHGPGGDRPSDDPGDRAGHRGGDGGGPARGRGGGRRRGGARPGGLPGVARARAARTASAVLHRLANALEEHVEELATLEARNAGKPIGDARGEMGMVVDTFRYYAGAPERLTGKTIPVPGGVDMTFREPLGVVALITPWNFPLTIASWKVAPALAAGNTVVLKPAELTPLTSLELERIALEAGLPEGVLNVVAGPRLGLRAAARGAPGRGQGGLHGLDRGGARDRGGRGGHHQARDPGARWQVGQHRVRRRRPRAGRRQRRPEPCSATRGRTAAPARASSWSARRSTASWSAWRRRLARSPWATRSTSPPPWAR